MKTIETLTPRSSSIAEAAARIDQLLAEATILVGTDPRRALVLSEQALAIARDTGDALQMARARRAEGIAHLWLAEYPKALETLQYSLKESQRLQDASGEASARNAIGVVYTRLGDPAAALEEYRESLAIRRRIGDFAGQAMTLHNIGIEHRQLGDLEAARGYYEQAVAIDRAMGDRMGEGRTLVSLGLVVLLQNDIPSAIERFEEALAVAREVDDRVSQAQCLENLAAALMKKGEIAQAVAISRDCLALCRELGNADYEAEALAGLGEALHQQGDPARRAEAIEYLQLAVVMTEQTGARRVQMGAYAALAAMFEADGDFRKALFHYKLYHETERAILGEEAERRARTLSVRLEVEQARYEAEIHRLKNLELATANASLQEKTERLDHEASHDVLTGLPNRRYLLPWLDDRFAEVRAGRGAIAIALVDVDRFKSINDTLTHPVGDAVLREVAATLHSGCREEYDMAARFGGEEFVLALPRIPSVEEAQERFNEIRALVEARDWTRVDPRLKACTISIGVCFLASGSKDETPAQALAAADRALYAAKHGGRNQVRLVVGVAGDAAIV